MSKSSLDGEARTAFLLKTERRARESNAETLLKFIESGKRGWFEHDGKITHIIPHDEYKAERTALERRV